MLSVLKISSGKQYLFHSLIQVMDQTVADKVSNQILLSSLINIIFSRD